MNLKNISERIQELLHLRLTMRTLITNIKKLVQVETQAECKDKVFGHDMDTLPCLENAFLIIENGLIAKFGEMESANSDERMANKELLNSNFDKTIDASGKMILPTYVDSHTHLVHAASREDEFVMRIKGKTYAEVAAAGGGILNSAKKMAAISEDELFDISIPKLEEAIKNGTGAIEIKSGYGLNTEAELKMLRVIRRLKELKRIPIKASFLAAHAYPLEYKENHQGYLDLIINEMLPKVADEGLADYIDAFCEQGFFSVDETEQVLEAGAKYGLVPKIHANQLHNSGGIQVGVKHKAISVDHLESLGEEEIKCLQNSNTLPVLLPGAAFFLAMNYQPARALIDANLPVVIASDYNPGSCPSSNMNFMMSLACTQLKMTPNEAINSVTLNGAASLGMQNELGSICIGKKASLIITKPIPSLEYIPYNYAHDNLETMILS
jgi:imidazolonepropionase